MFAQVETKDLDAVEREVQSDYHAMFAPGDPAFISTAFGWVNDCFTGRYNDYPAIDARYHDLEHTMQGTLCMSRLLHGRFLAEAKPVVPQRLFELGLVAMLFHDTGYLKKRDDVGGTGAKYTFTHVARSVHFAEEFLEEHGMPIGDIRKVQHMIRCTGVNVDLSRVPFESELEQIVGFALGTSDLLGQMAADDYVDKLPILYAEFEESARFYDGKMIGVQTFSSAEDLIRKTPEFWEQYVLPKLNHDFWGLYRFLNVPYPNGPNEYIEKVQANIDEVRRRLTPRQVA